MSQKWSAFISVFGIISVASLLLSFASCGRDQQLTSLTVQPASETFGATNIPVDLDAGLNVQLRAIGGYSHPNVTKDLTSQVVWSSNTPGLATVNSTGLLTATGQDCGNGLVSATVTTSKGSGNIATAYMTVTVVCFTGTGGTGPTLTVVFAGGTGIVVSTPPGIGCSATCGAFFASGTSITLTATPNGASTRTTWVSGCDSMNGNMCMVNGLTAPRVVTVSFQ
jgi:hypothetical protein